MVYILYNGFFILLYSLVLLYCAMGHATMPKAANTSSFKAFVTSLRDRFKPVQDTADNTLRTQPAKAEIPCTDKKAIKELRNRQKCCSIIMLGVIVIELVVNLMNFSMTFTGTLVSDYPRGTKHSASMIRYMHEREKSNLFFRAETTHSQTLNDGALNGYNGVSTFTSSANVKVTEFMRLLGYGAKNNYNRYCFEESSPVSNLFLNLKYMLERQDKVELNFFFDDVHQYGKVHLLENAAYLPLGFLAESGLGEMEFVAEQNAFLFQNKLFKSATGTERDVWTLVPGKNLSIEATGVTISSKTLQSGYCSYVTPADAAGTLVYRYVANQSGLFCVDMNLSKVDNLSFWKGDKELYKETYSIPQTLSVCHLEKGETVEIHLTCNSNTSDAIRITGAIINEDVFWDGYEILNASTLELTTFRNTLVDGRIQCDRDGILYTSIPQDGNWIAYVDGAPAEIQLIGDAMIGLKLTQGDHRITFRYRNRAFSLGLTVTLLCAVAFILIYFWIYKPKFWQKLTRKSGSEDGQSVQEPQKVLITHLDPEENTQEKET